MLYKCRSAPLVTPRWITQVTIASYWTKPASAVLSPVELSNFSFFSFFILPQRKPFVKRGQAAVEYILLIALGLFVLVIAFALAFYVRTFADATLLEVALNRNETIQMLIG